MIDAYDHVQFSAPAGQEERLRAYYGGVLGMTEIPKPAGLGPGCWFGIGEVQVHLGIEEGFRPSKKAHAAFRVRDVDAMAARISDHGGEVKWGDGIPGVRRFHSVDPVGNRLEFLEYVE